MRLLHRFGWWLAISPLVYGRLASISIRHRHSSAVCQLPSLSNGRETRTRALVTPWLTVLLRCGSCGHVDVRDGVDVVVGFGAGKHLQPT